MTEDFILTFFPDQYLLSGLPAENSLATSAGSGEVAFLADLSGEGTVLLAHK